ncbi:peptidylprolyl isomerase, partial [bacterium]|nr:peptidylprolyl isomerase [bacterium]MBU1024625.1 peptidylprolyl isomerase [bacterium]
KTDNITDTTKALSTLDEILGIEIAMNHPREWIDPKRATQSDKPFKPQESPSPEDILEAWKTFSTFSDKPDTARKLFSKVEKFVNSNEQLNAQAGIVGPVKKSRIGKKANDFISTLEPGQVSETVKFKNGFLIVQLIDDTGETVELGYVYIPADK